MKILTATVALTIISMLFVTTTEQSNISPEYDLAIVNGLIIDGSGKPRYKGDLAIKGERISQRSSAQARSVRT
ncbi:MAG TPA: hypothetical protein VJ023_08940 [Pyrinomonadaceae bacterium]|nr:hypothetical protein [Pyrinomonadaceae bacterium]